MARAWHLVSRPTGEPTPDNFELRETSLSPLERGMVHIRNEWLSVDPYMRGRMNDAPSYAPPYELDQPMQGGAVSIVLESKADGFAPGDRIVHRHGWRDEAVVPADTIAKTPEIDVPDQLFLSTLGLTGATAYFGLLEVASAKPGDIVFVSAAAGAVGSIVVQVAKAKGMTVIGSAGGEAKCEFVRTLGADAVIDYKAQPVLEGLKRAAPDGIDVYFDNVGGDHLDAALALARLNARITLCGMIDVYNSGKPQCLAHLSRAIGQRVRMQGFIFTDYAHLMDRFYDEVGSWVSDGTVRSEETVFEGLESTRDAFLGLFSGTNMGKMLVKL